MKQILTEKDKRENNPKNKLNKQGKIFQGQEICWSYSVKITQLIQGNENLINK